MDKYLLYKTNLKNFTFTIKYIPRKIEPIISKVDNYLRLISHIYSNNKYLVSVRAPDMISCLNMTKTP